MAVISHEALRNFVKTADEVTSLRLSDPDNELIEKWDERSPHIIKLLCEYILNEEAQPLATAESGCTH
jgi:hypothetical protein